MLRSKVRPVDDESEVTNGADSETTLGWLDGEMMFPQPFQAPDPKRFLTAVVVNCYIGNSELHANVANYHLVQVGTCWTSVARR